jgi:site-specific DNA-methyltransferase (adenine-specific)
MISETHNIDCLEFMRGLPDGFFDLVIADPPYGIGVNHSMGRRKGDKASDYKPAYWDKKAPGPSFFSELKRVSNNQIIWGANHFIESCASNSSCWLMWDKMFSEDVSFAQIELAWTSFESVSKKIELHPGQPGRIHPTQKPVALYKWLLTNYAKPGHKIFDPMMGSQSSRIAAWDMGFDYWGCELDADYYRDGEARFKAHIAKPVLFAPEQMYNFEQASLF